MLRIVRAFSRQFRWSVDLWGRSGCVVLREHILSLHQESAETVLDVARRLVFCRRVTLG